MVLHLLNSTLIQKTKVVSIFWCQEKKCLGNTRKINHEFQTKPSLMFLFFLVFSRCCWRCCCNSYPHPLRAAAVGSARYSIIQKWAGKQSTHLQICRLNQTPCLVSHHSWTSSRCEIVAWCSHGLSTLSESYLKRLKTMRRIGFTAHTSPWDKMTFRWCVCRTQIITIKWVSTCRAGSMFAKVPFFSSAKCE